MAAPAVGTMAPEFELTNQHGEKISLASFRGKKNVVVIFYPFAFSGICTGELCSLRDDLAAFQNDDVELLAISCDPMFSLKAFAEHEGYKFSLLAWARKCAFPSAPYLPPSTPCRHNRGVNCSNLLPIGWLW